MFLAQHQPSGNEVALKVLLGTQDPETVKRFRREASITTRLQAPAIVRTLDVGFDGQHHYYAMEHCPGPTLKERLRQGPLPSLEAASLVAKLAEAAAEAHQWGVIHRDLKPANVILSEPHGEPRITDFGLARDYAQERLTQTGDVMGTPSYMAPEQFRGDRGLDHRVDIYALGVILYQLLTGQRPYQAKNLPELASLVEMGQAPPPRSLDPNIPQALEAACLRAMDPDPNKRFLTASAFAAALTAVAQGPSKPPRRPRSARTARASRPAPAKRAERPTPALLWGGWAVAGLALIALLWVSLTPAAAPPPDPVDPAPTEAARLSERLEELQLLREEHAPPQTLARHLLRASELASDPVQQAELEAERRLLLQQLERAEQVQGQLETLSRGNTERRPIRELEPTFEALLAAVDAGLPSDLELQVKRELQRSQVRAELLGRLDDMLNVRNPMQLPQLSADFYLRCWEIEARFPEAYQEALEEKLSMLRAWEQQIPPIAAKMAILQGLTLKQLGRGPEALSAYRRAARLPGARNELAQFFNVRLFDEQDLLEAQSTMFPTK